MGTGITAAKENEAGGTGATRATDEETGGTKNNDEATEANNESVVTVGLTTEPSADLDEFRFPGSIRGIKWSI